MVRIAKVYTRAGDGGLTSLASGQRVPKDDPRIEAIGTVDELNSSLGAALAMRPSKAVAKEIRQIQGDLFEVGALLCPPKGIRGDKRRSRINDLRVAELERLMDRLNKRLPPLAGFVLPGGTPAAAALHVARTVCRRAERRVAAMGRRRTPSPAMKYINRLSDVLFVLARAENAAAKAHEPVWMPGPMRKTAAKRRAGTQR